MSSEAETSQTSSNGLWFWAVSGLGILSMFVLGWLFGKDNRTEGLPPEPAQTFAISCQPIPEGMEWTGAQLVPIASAPIETVELPDAEPKPDWTKSIAASFAPLGFGWMGLNLGEDQVSVTGEAPTRGARTDGFGVAERAIRAADDPDQANIDVRNDITIARGRAEWADGIKESLQGLGFDWLDLSVRGPMATVSGSAPDADARDEAFRLANNAISRNPQAAGQVERVVNQISLDGEDDAGAAAVADLMNTEAGGLTVESCGATFAEIMNGRNIQFTSASSDITAENARLLDSLTTTAILCANTSGFNIEVAGHTDASGAATFNDSLSDERANAVRTYLVSNGVDEERVIANGYGSSQLLADLSETDPLHRRTEFRVTSAE